MANPILDNEQQVVQGENFGDEVFKFYQQNGLAPTLKEFGITLEQFQDSLGYPQEKEFLEDQGSIGSHQSMNEQPDYQQQFAATEEDVAGMSLSELLSQGSEVASNAITSKLEELGIPPESALLVAGVLGKSPKNIVKGGKGMLNPKNKVFKRDKPVTSRKGKKVQSNQKEKFTSDGDTKHIVKNKNFDKPTPKTKEPTKGLTTQRRAELTTAAGLTTGLGLSGLRDKDGSLKPTEPTPEVVTPEVESEVESEASSNQFGYHKREGQNFWTIDDSDSYWDAHEMEDSSPWEEAPLKQQPQQELDWDFWFKQ